jgi:riboflavin kinase / FMN adenylyltransferase
MHSLTETHSHASARILSIGNFDGVHRGHQTLFQAMCVMPKEVYRTVVTFKNHPVQILKSMPNFPFISTWEHRWTLLKKWGLNRIIPLLFTEEMAKMSYDEFLKKIYFLFPFQGLVLGEGAVFGRHRKGDRKAVENLAQKMGFHTLYIPKTSENGEIISSQMIREAIERGDLSRASFLLGRPYSLLTFFRKGNARLLSFCFPPDDEYPVAIEDTILSLKIEKPFLKLSKAFSGTFEVIFI